MFIEAHRDELNELVELAKIQSTEASNRIEGIFTSEDRLKNLVLEKTTPASRNESEIAGYRDVLNTIHKNYDYIPVTANYILQLHKDLYKFTGAAGQALLRFLTILFVKSIKMEKKILDLDQYKHGKPQMQLTGCVQLTRGQRMKRIHCF